MRRLNLFVLTILVVVLAGSSLALAQDAATVQLGPVTKAVMDRGQLVCGVNSTVRGFGFVNDAGEFSGFDVDYCRALAAPILGDSTKVNFRPTVAADRQTVLQSGEVDLIIRNTTF